LADAWINNNWAIKAGNFFALEWDPAIHILPMDLDFPINKFWYPRLSMDHGTSAPCVTLFGGTAPGDVPGIPKGSIVIFDEISTHDPMDPGLNSSLGWPLGKIAEEIIERCAHWKMWPQGVADDASGFSAIGDTLITTYRNEYNINFQKPNKGRVQSLAKIKDLLSNAALKNGKPGLFISARADYLIQTLPIIQRDPRRRDDIDTHGADHGVDSLRYMVNTEPFVIRVRATTGY
jgi:hypothetical protein